MPRRKPSCGCCLPSFLNGSRLMRSFARWTACCATAKLPCNTGSMQIEQFYLGCLAHASYLVHDNGAAAVIDPQRDVQIYLDSAAQLNVRIEHVILTHLHADFV